MTDILTQCEAITMSGRRCKRAPYGATLECRWYNLGDLVLRSARRCTIHLTRAERDLVRSALEDQPDAWTASKWKVLPDTPACWSWPVPEQIDRDNPWSTIVEWQNGRCALCGEVRYLVADHCHNSGFKRGLLCIGCNNHEGYCPKSPCGCDGYRERPPAAILGIQATYGLKYVPTPAEPS
jgi:hypothetical protein